MANKIIGFIGMDAYDIILYLGRISCNNNEKVLLVDNSYSKSLLLCIPNVVEIDSDEDYIDYRGIDFTTREVEDTDYTMYDKVFVYYGLYNTYSDYDVCSDYILVSDAQLHTLLLLKESDIDSNKIMNIILKDVYEVMIPEYKILKTLNLHREVKIYTHYLDGWDVKYRVICQEQSLTSFYKISNYIKEYLYDVSKTLYPEQSKKSLNNVIKNALKGN